MGDCLGKRHSGGLGSVFWLLVLFSGASAGLQAQEAPLAAENELILELRLEGRPLEGDILGYQRGDDFLVSLSELLRSLNLPINVDARAGMAGGWFIDEERRFELNLDENRVESDGETFSLEPDDVVRFENDLFATTSAIEQWLPLELDPIIRQLLLNVTPTETLPLQERLARRDRQPGSGFTGREDPELPLQRTPYRLLGPQTTSLRLDLSSTRPNEDASTSQSARYSLLSRGDLAGMTSTLSLTGRDDDTLTGGRFRLERSQFEGPLALNHFELGDVSPNQGANANLGVLLRGGGTRGGLEGRFAEESIDLRGDILPDWEVELYRNGILIEIQEVGQDGQYEFLDVPLEFGENRFEFVFFGPFGEERRKEVTHFVGPDRLGTGGVSYELTATQAQRSVFDVNPPSGEGDRDTGQYSGSFNLGLTRNLIGRFDVESFKRDGERLENYDVGLSAAFARLQASAGYDFRPDRQDRITGSARSRIAGTSFSLNHTQFSTARLAPEDIPDDRNRWRSSLGLSAQPLGVSMDITADHTERQRSTTSRGSLGFSFRSGRRARVSQSFNYVREASDDEPTDEQTTGTLNFTTPMRPWRLRASASYGITPEAELQTVSGSANIRVGEDMTMNFDVRHSRTSDITRYRAGFNWLLDAVQISPRVSFDSNERWAGLISFSTNIVPRPGRRLPVLERLPQANSGAARTRVFLDRDGNGAFGADDKPLEGVRMEAVQSFRNAETGPDGNAYLTRLRPFRRTDIAIDTNTLPDFEMDAAGEGHSIIPRPGSWSEVSVPVTRTMELEGHVRVARDAGNEPVSRVLVRLLDDEGEVVRGQRTAFDGFFLFTGVAPGDYELVLGDEHAERARVSPEPFQVGGDGGVLRGLDFLLAPPRQRTLIDRGEEDEAAPARESDAERPAQPDIAPPPADDEGAGDGDPPGGAWTVQLGAFSNRANAETQWQTLSTRYPGLFTDFRPRYAGSGELVRVVIEPGTDEAQARRFCAELREREVACLARPMPE